MTSLENLGYRQELKRTLTVRDLIIYGMVFMVPISPFGVFGFVAKDAHGMVPLAYLVGLIGMFFTAMSYASMSRAFPVAGSVYSYVGRGLHQAAGFMAGWLILLDYILVPALLYVFSTVALRPLFPAVPDLVWLLSFVGFNALVNLLGVHLTARVNLCVLALELVALALFVVVGLVALHGGQGAGALTLRPLYDPTVFSMATVAGATSIAVLSFLGFDGISTLAEESLGRDSVARATLASLLLVGALFVLQTWIAADLAQGTHFSSAETAFYEISQRAGGTGLRLAVVVANIIASGIANALAAQAAVSRILYAMARDGRLPAVLARVHPRYRTPYVSILFVAVISIGIGLIFANRLDDLTRIVNFGALTGFLLLHVAVINYYVIRGRSRAWVRHLLMPLAGFAVLAYVLYEMDRAAQVMGAVWIALGVAYFAVLSLLLKKPAAIDL
ncbi:MAG: APC family permease [Gammaproteobacteria bacterium]|nr:APC family permease [Gammaproteobacteria bacterium]